MRITEEAERETLANLAAGVGAIREFD